MTEQTPPEGRPELDETQPFALGSRYVTPSVEVPPEPVAPPSTPPQPTTPYPQPPPPVYGQQPYLPQPSYSAPLPVAYGYPPVPAPYGVDPSTGVPWSDKTKVTAGLLQVLLSLFGVPGVGRLYAGNLGIGLTQLLGYFLGWFLVLFLVGILIVPAVWLWAVIDGIVLLSAGGRDGLGRPLR